MSDHDDLVANFSELTGVSDSRAQEYLTASEWNLSAAVGAFFADVDEEGAAVPSAGSSSQQPAAPADYTGPRTLDGRPAPQSALHSSSSSSKKPAKKTGVSGISTLSSLRGGDHGDGDDQSDDEDETERKGPRDLFAGGEKSGLAVQDPARGAGRDKDPSSVIKDILAKARANAKRSSSAEEDAPGPSQSSNFQGSGTTVGGDGTESRSIPGRVRAQASRDALPVETRTLHLWNDGFSIEDGPLRRYDDPEHAMDLNMIRTGRAPLHLMNVEPGQRCDVRLAQHEEDWHQVARIYRPFGGEGHRLGSPVPGDTSVAFTEAAPTAAAASASSTPASPANVDNSQPTVAVRFQLPDGSRLPARFNLTNTVGDLYQFAANVAPEMRARAFVIQSTFPSKDHTDREQKLEEVDAFKRGGTAVVKWA